MAGDDDRKPSADSDEEDSLPRRFQEQLYTSALRPTFFYICFALGLAAAVASGFALAAAGWSSGVGTGVAYGMGFVPALFLLTAWRGTTMTVGADGLHLRWLGRGQFISYADIESITYQTPPIPGRWPTHYVQVHLRSGKKHWFPGGRKPVDALVEQASRAHEAYQQRTPPPAEDLAALRGAEAEAKARIEGLRRMGSGAAHPRTAPIHRDELWRVLDSPAADEADRAAAALALGSESTEPDRQRLRIVSDATASPRLRFVVDQAAAEEAYDDEEVAAALAELEQRRAEPD